MKKYLSMSLIAAALLTGCGGGGGGDTSTSTNPTPDTNAAPIVSAGDDKRILLNSSVELTGTATDTDGQIVSREWRNESGTVVSTGSTYTHTGDAEGDFVYSFRATDDDGATTVDYVAVTVFTSTAIPYDAPEISAAKIEEYLGQINEARSKVQDCGTYGIFQPAPPLKWSDELYKAAAEHSYDMSIVGETSSTFSHDGSGTASDWTSQVQDLGRGSYFYERIENNGYLDIGGWARSENAHASPADHATAMQDWLESDGHCANIMDPLAEEVGIAVEYNPDSIWGYYWTQNFGYRL